VPHVAHAHTRPRRQLAPAASAAPHACSRRLRSCTSVGKTSSLMHGGPPLHVAYAHTRPRRPLAACRLRRPLRLFTPPMLPRFRSFTSTRTCSRTLPRARSSTSAGSSIAHAHTRSRRSAAPSHSLRSCTSAGSPRDHTYIRSPPKRSRRPVSACRPVSRHGNSHSSACGSLGTGLRGPGLQAALVTAGAYA
jgi:hypothetical protein